MKKIIITIIVLVILSVTALSITNRIKITEKIELENIVTCKNITWQEQENIISEITKEENVLANCTAYSEENKTNYVYTCITGIRQYKENAITGSKIVQKSKEVCQESKINIYADNKQMELDFEKWGSCTKNTEEDTLIITCESKLDSNNDGICQPGESCTQFRITNNGVQKLERNSRMNFTEDDKTFFVKNLDMNEVTVR